MHRGYKIKKQKRFSSTTTIVVLFIVFLLITWAVINNSIKQKNIVLQTEMLDKEIEELQQQNLELTDLIDYFSSTEYVEKEAREKLNLVKPGEKVVIITHRDKNIIDANNSEEKEQKNFPIIRWWKYFFK